ncbi:MAG TPA: ribonuclease P protein component [Mycobacteriales bacterium]|nr:ribonuclease P protein component [Mycobacteriales bacterium]
MLARPSRLHRPAEFRAAARSGRRVSAPGLVLHAYAVPAEVAAADTPKVGFVVGKVVGPAVTRNRVRRRLQHLIAGRLDQLPARARLVVRATPAAAGQSYALLGQALDAALAKAYR